MKSESSLPRKPILQLALSRTSSLCQALLALHLDTRRLQRLCLLCARGLYRLDGRLGAGGDGLDLGLDGSGFLDLDRGLARGTDETEQGTEHTQQGEQGGDKTGGGFWHGGEGEFRVGLEEVYTNAYGELFARFRACGALTGKLVDFQLQGIDLGQLVLLILIGISVFRELSCVLDVICLLGKLLGVISRVTNVDVVDCKALQ